VSTACETLYSTDDEIKSNVGRTDSNRINANEILRPARTRQRKHSSGELRTRRYKRGRQPGHGEERADE